MFTDLVGSTETTTRLGDDAAASLFAEHDGVVRDAFAAHGGRQIRSTGDGFLALFDSARSGVACALAIQREFAAREDGLRVRIGIGAGEVQEDDGRAVRRGDQPRGARHGSCRRWAGARHRSVRQLVGTMPGARFRDRGRVTLKGFPKRQHLHEVRPAEGLPRRRVPRASPDAP